MITIITKMIRRHIMTRITFVSTEEEKYAYSESAYEGRMTLSEWIRCMLNEAANGHSVPRSVAKNPVSTIEELKLNCSVVSGNDVPAPSVPKWAENDNPMASEARKIRYGSNALRRLSSEEADFNKLCVVPGQKYDEGGAPRLDKFGEYIPCD
jgi:hypothetical protein